MRHGLGWRRRPWGEPTDSLLGLIAALLVGTAPLLLPSQAQGQGPRSIRLYVFDCATLKNRDAGTYNLTREQVESVDMSVPCFLVVHPKGTLLWETGKNDAIFNRPEGGPRGDRVTKSLTSQLAEIGYKPADLTYLALSHFHDDHAGNANDYAGSTWIVQRAERDFMFGKEPPANADQFNALKRSKTVVIEGDHDVFGDGTAVLIATPGHTPGHQSLLVRLAKTGPVVLSGDLYHFPAERTLTKMPTRELSTETGASREKLELLLNRTGAQLWIQHDIIAFKTLRKSPAYYE